MDRKVIMNKLNTPWNPVDYQNGIEDNFGNQVLFSDLHGDEKKYLCDAVNDYDNLKVKVASYKKAINWHIEHTRKLQEDRDVLLSQLIDSLGAMTRTYELIESVERRGISCTIGEDPFLKVLELSIDECKQVLYKHDK